MELRRGDDVLCQQWILDQVGTEFTCTTIVELFLNDSVRVTGNNDNEAEIQGGYAGFSGHLIEVTES